MNAHKQEKRSRNIERQQHIEVSQRAAWKIADWCAALEIGKSTFYTLSMPPRSIKIGKLHKIIETPAAYVQRIAQMQAAA